MDGLDQGNILFGLRSEKYPDIPCYGVIITASCDIANSKVQKLYYLIGVDAKGWFCTEHSYHVVYHSKAQATFNEFHKKCNEFSLDANTLQRFSISEVQCVIKDTVPSKQQKAFEKLYNNFSVFCKPNMTNSERKTAVQKDKDVAINFLKDIERERIFHYFYLPQASYLNKSNKMDSGLIVDLQEIGSIPIEDAEKIVTPGIDNLILDPENKQECVRLKSLFWLEADDDFVSIEGKIVSPWREHLMQRFSHDFSRIGLDGATTNDYEELIGSIIKEGV